MICIYIDARSSTFSVFSFFHNVACVWYIITQVSVKVGIVVEYTRGKLSAAHN